VFDKLDQLEARYRDLEAQLADPAVHADGQRYTSLAKQHAELSDLVASYRAWREAGDEPRGRTRDAGGRRRDDRAMLEAEIAELTGQRTSSKRT
jgi:peptide chain release factor 1